MLWNRAGKYPRAQLKAAQFAKHITSCVAPPGGPDPDVIPALEAHDPHFSYVAGHLRQDLLLPLFHRLHCDDKDPFGRATRGAARTFALNIYTEDLDRIIKVLLGHKFHIHCFKLSINGPLQRIDT